MAGDSVGGTHEYAGEIGDTFSLLTWVVFGAAIGGAAAGKPLTGAAVGAAAGAASGWMSDRHKKPQEK